MKEIDPKLLPVPLEYTYPTIPMVLNIITGSDKRHANIYYVPEIGRYVKYESAVKEIIARRNISWVEWKTRWFLKLPAIRIGTEEWVNKYIEVFYNNRMPDTKRVIKENLLRDPNYICDFFMTKTDFIEAYKISRKNSNRGIYDYDFSKVPEFIKGASTMVMLFCNEIDPYTQKPYGEYRVNYSHFVTLIRDHPKLSNRISGEKRSVITNSSGRFIAEHIEEIKEFLRDGYSSAAIGQFLGGIRGEQICKAIRNHYDYTVTELKGDIAMSSGELLIKNFLVENNIPYKSQVTVKSIKGRNRNEVRIDFVLPPKTFEKEVWIEYNGKQHYEEVEFFSCGKEEVFKKQKIRDMNVKNFCKDNNVLFIEVPYILYSKESIYNFLSLVLFENIDPITLIDYDELYK